VLFSQLIEFCCQGARPPFTTSSPVWNQKKSSSSIIPSRSCHFHERGRPSVLSSQLIIMLVSRKGTSSVRHVCLIMLLCFTKGVVPPCYQSQLIIVVFVTSKEARPPCYHHNSSSCCVSRKGTSSVLSITTHHHVCFTKGHVLRAINHQPSSSVLSKGVVPPCYQSQLIIIKFFTKGGRSPCYQSQLIIMLCFTKGDVLRAINHNSSSCCFHERHVPPCYQSQLIISCGSRKARPPVLSITTHHHKLFSRKGHVPPCYQSQLIIMLWFHEQVVPPCYQSQLIIMLCFQRKARPPVINHNSSSCQVNENVPPCYQSQLIIMLCHEGHVPPCYQSQLIITLCFHEGARPPCYQSQLIIVVFSQGHAPCYQLIIIVTKGARPPAHHNSSSLSVFTKGTSSVLSITTHHVATKGHVLRAINHNSSLCFHERASSVLSITTHHHAGFHERARPSVLSITTHHHVFSRKGHVLRAISHNSSRCVSRKHVPPCYQSQLIITLFSRSTSSVLSITTHHVVFHEGVILRASSQLIIIMLCFTKAPCSDAQLIIMLCFTKGHVLRAINHNSSSCRFSRKGHVLRAISHNSSSCCHESGHVPPCYQSQLIIMLCFHERGHVASFTHNCSSSCCVSERGRPSVLSITTHHHVVFSRRLRPPCYQSQLIIMLCFHERHVPPCYQSQLIIIAGFQARPSV
jgi:hypothetical protein